MKNNLPEIPYEVILNAKQGDEIALKYVLNVFTPYISKIAAHSVFSCYEDMITYIQSKLIMGIIHNFEILPEIE